MTLKKVKYRLKGHESFILREGWLTKGLFAVEENPKLFAENFGADDLGVGTNMAKAIRYWMKAADIIKETGKARAVLTEFGRLLLEKDAYLEDYFFLWLIHCKLVSNREQATSWYFFFQILEKEEFTKQDLEEELQEYLLEKIGAEEISHRSLQDDCDAILQMYVKRHIKEINPEEKKISPFWRLGLVQQQGAKFQKVQPDLSKLDALIVLFTLQNCLERQQGYYSVSIENLMMQEQSPGKILHLKKSFLIQYLEELEQKKYLTLNRTAGLDMVYQKERFSQKQIIEDYFNLIKKVPHF